ncbi:uncharacterized protein ACNLHF_006874 [Anomaloglossus baeobatrachus]
MWHIRVQSNNATAVAYINHQGGTRSRLAMMFLQSGLQLGLSLNSLKGQVSALSVLFQRRLARLAQVRTFMQDNGQHPVIQSITEIFSFQQT